MLLIHQLRHKRSNCWTSTAAWTINKYDFSSTAKGKPRAFSKTNDSRNISTDETKSITSDNHDPCDSSNNEGTAQGLYRRQQVFDEQWNNWFETYRKFVAETGFTRVPHNYHDKTLYNWYSHQKAEYRKRLCDHSNYSMTDERLEKLQQVGGDADNWFDTYKALYWDQKYQELCDFYQQHGHSNVPFDHLTLYSWCQQQRYSYKNRHRISDKCQHQQQQQDTTSVNDEVLLNLERVEMLNQIEFEWDTNHRLEANWMKCYEALKRYKLRFGDWYVWKLK